MGAIELPYSMVDSVMKHGSVARLSELTRALVKLTGHDRNDVTGYLLAAALAYTDSLCDHKVEIPAFTILRDGRKYMHPSRGAGTSPDGGGTSSALSSTTITEGVTGAVAAVRDEVPAPSAVDVAVITIREDEFKAVLDRLPGYKHTPKQWWDYQCVSVATEDAGSLTVAVGRIVDQGSLSAQALATSMILDLKPRWILVVGIAGAIPATDYSLGDVLLSQRVHDFTVSAKAAGRPPSYQDLGGPPHQDVVRLLANMQANAALLGAWNHPEPMRMAVPEIQVPESPNDPRLCGPTASKQGVIQCLQSKFKSPVRGTEPIFYTGPVIDASTLVKDPEVVDIWQNTASHACAIEMELSGVDRAARHFGKGDTRVLAIRGFSDVVGFRRGPEWTQYACHSAASFANALIRSGLLKSS
jgi:nucleoside phosphorylase